MAMTTDKRLQLQFGQFAVADSLGCCACAAARRQHPPARRRPDRALLQLACWSPSSACSQFALFRRLQLVDNQFALFCRLLQLVDNQFASDTELGYEL